MIVLRRAAYLLRFAIATMVHEWLATVCLVTSLAAVLCPIMLILGLKHGTVESLRQNLLKDPRNLELRPKNSLMVNESLLDKIKQTREVAFVIPKTRFLGSTAVRFQSADRSVDVDLIPTDTGDPIIKTYHSVQPLERETVLTARAAQILGVSAGGSVTMRLERVSSTGNSESVQLDLKVAGILPITATKMNGAMVQLPIVSAAERYREGMSVPEFGWPGPESQRAEPMFHGLLVVSDAHFSEKTIREIYISTKLFSHRSVSVNDPDPSLRQALGENRGGILFYADEPQFIHVLLSAGKQLDGKTSDLYAWTRPREVALVTSDGRKINRTLRCLSPAIASSIEQAPAFDPTLLLPKSLQGMDFRQVEVSSPTGSVVFRARTQPVPASLSDDSSVYADPWLAGVLSHVDARNIVWSEELRYFLRDRSGYAGLRLYAKDITDVESLARKLEIMGIPCDTEADKIAKVIEFDKSLTVLFWMIAGFSLTGGGAAILFSMVGAVERRRRHYAICWVVGLSRPWLALLLFAEAVMIAVMAWLACVAAFQGISALINKLFQSIDNPGGSICRLPAQLQFSLGLLCIVFAATATIAGCVRLLALKPSESIH